MLKKIISGASTLFVFIFAFLIFAPKASAHEAYVLPTSFFWKHLHDPDSFYTLNALKNPHNLHLTLLITACIIVVMLLTFLFRLSSPGRKFSTSLEKFAWVGPIIIRLSIATAFFFSASSMSFLGPELPLSNIFLSFAHITQIILFVLSGMIAIGLFTEVAGLIALALYTIAFFHFGIYLVTYLNYFGEIVVLFLFGMRKWSVDGWLFGPAKYLLNFRKYETSIIRICYGIALIFAAVTVKFLHPALILQVINEWNLTQFHWLFPRDPMLVALGSALAEITIGFFIMIGFEMRLTVVISLFYITLSLLFFREMVWPHVMLYGISFSLILQPETFTIDHLLFDSKGIPFWRRPFLPHKKDAVVVK